MNVALIIQHAKRMPLIALSLWLIWLYYIFPHFLTNRTIFGKSYWK